MWQHTGRGLVQLYTLVQHVQCWHRDGLLDKQMMKTAAKPPSLLVPTVSMTTSITIITLTVEIVIDALLLLLFTGYVSEELGRKMYAPDA